MKIDFIDLRTQYLSYQSEIDQAVLNVLAAGQYIMGEEVTLLESELADYLQCQHAIACSSGTDAILLVLMALEFKPGDEIITTPFTFIAAAEMIAHLGLKPVFVDIQADTYNLNPEQLKNKLSEKTRAIIPVSLYGQPADMDEINAIAREYSEKFKNKIYVIEDAAQSFGASYKNQKSGNLSDIGCTSFFPSKPLGCYGDGGAIFTNDESIAKRIASLRIHGQTKRYFHEYIGINGRLDTLQAAILRVKLKHFSGEIQKRAQVAARYEKLLHHPAIKLPFIKEDRDSVYAQYSVRVRHRDRIVNELKAENIPTAIHYPIPLHLQKCFAYLGHAHGDFPVAEKISHEIVSLPMSPYLTELQQEHIAHHLLRAVNKIHHEQVETRYEHEAV